MVNGSGSDSTVLALNSGSSSLKFGLFLFVEEEGDVDAKYRGTFDSIGTEQGNLRIRGAAGQTVVDEPHRCATQPEAIQILVKHITRFEMQQPIGIGYRIVHGGRSLREHQRITPEVMRQLEAAVVFAPLHIPPAVQLIREVESHYPDVLQCACCDTAFHRTLPEAASRFPLPQKFWEDGIHRYGFHGISCESILHSLEPPIPPRIIIAHLGNGASVTAIADGVSVDTSMGLTPTGGIVMSTRTGDLDPGVLVHILQTTSTDPDVLEKLINRQSGLLGISGISGDMRGLHQAAADSKAQLALEMFCRSVKKTIGAYAALLGGLDLLVFAGGIGEHDAVVRARICEGLEFLDIVLDATRNGGNFSEISRRESRTRVLIVPTDEEAQIARHVYRLLQVRHSVPVEDVT